MARQIVLYVKDTDPAKIRRILAFIVAFAVATKRHLRDEKGRKGTAGFLDTLTSTHSVLQHRQVVVNHSLDMRIDFAFIVTLAQEIANNVQAETRYVVGLLDIAKILRRVFMVLWLASLPLTLVEQMGWTSILIYVIVTFGIDGMSAFGLVLDLV